MPTYSSGNNKEYLVHIITALHLVEQKGTAAEVKEAFAALVAVRKKMSPFFNFSENVNVATGKDTANKVCILNIP